MTTGYAPGRTFRVPGDTLTLKLGAAQTGGALSLFESRTNPGDGPPTHVHRREDETFIVLEGRFEFVANGAARQAKPGDTIHVPRGVPHSFRNLGPGPGRMYILLTPGGAESLRPFSTRAR